MLLRGNAVAFAGDNASDWILCDPVNHLIYLSGCPRAGLLRQALDLFPDALSVIAGCEHAGALADVLRGWTSDRIRVHTLSRQRLSRPAAVSVSWLRPSEIATIGAGDRLLRETLMEASREVPVAAARVNGRPVSFCFASSQTETLWNVSVETPEPFRQKHFGAACAAWSIAHYLACGKRPVWGAAESNPASRHMAESIGLVECGQFTLFECAYGR
jgi:hypothetical protein